MFDASTYAARRQHLMETLGGGRVLLLGHRLAPVNAAANPYPFRQDGTFLYFTGLDRPGLDLMIDADAGTSTLYGRDRTLDDVVWEGPQPSLREDADAAGIEHTADPGGLGDAVRAAGDGLHLLPPYRPEHRLRLRDLLLDAFGDGLDAYVSEPLIRAVIAQREAKSDAEVAEMERALAITAKMHTVAMLMAKPDAFEREVAGPVEGVALGEGGYLAYGLICTVRGEVLHNHFYGRRMQAGDLLLLDGGAAAPSHYASDITRTFPVGGAFESRQREVYEVVLQALTAATATLRPGIMFRDVHRRACRHLVAGLKALGLMTGDEDEAVAEGAHALFFPHGLGHMIGLDVHDMEALGEDLVGYGDEAERSEQFGTRSLRLARTLRPGFAVTVEPGLYFIDPLIDRWRAERRHTAFIDYAAIDRFRGMGGVRIEDNALITADGHRVLGPPIPKEPGDIEALMGSG